MATLSGVVRDSSGALAARIVRAYFKDSGILAAETTSNATTGAFSLTVLPHYRYTVIAVDAIYDPYCQLLMHMDGSNNGTTFTEETGRVVTRNGDAKTVTTYSAFGGSSAYFDGAGDYLTVPSTSDLLLGASDFTLDAFVRPVALPTSAGYNAICGKYDSTNNVRSYSLEFYYTGSVQQVVFMMSTSGTAVDYNLQCTYTCSLTAFTHLRVCRSGGTVYLFANGSLLGTLSVGTSALYDNTTVPFSIGARAGGVATSNAYIDEVRLRKRVASSTSDFSANPVSEPFSRLIRYGENAIIYDDVVPT